MKTELEELAQMITTRDFLVYQRNIELRSDYVSKLGKYELAAFKLSYDAERMSRKIALAQEYMSQNQEIDEDEINSRLDEEFLAKDHLLEEMTANLMMAMNYQSLPQLSREEKSQMLYSYRQLVKAYYPGFYPNDGSKELQWEKAQDLYQQSDIDALIEMEEQAEQAGILENVEEKVDAEQVKKLHTIIQQEVNAILQQFPFNVKDLLEDEEQLKKHREEIDKNADKSSRKIQELQKKLDILFEPVSKILS